MDRPKRLDPWTCPECGELLGFATEAGQFLIMTVAISEGTFQCLACGHVKHWHKAHWMDQVWAEHR